MLSSSSLPASLRPVPARRRGETPPRPAPARPGRGFAELLSGLTGKAIEAISGTEAETQGDAAYAASGEALPKKAEASALPAKRSAVAMDATAQTETAILAVVKQPATPTKGAKVGADGQHPAPTAVAASESGKILPVTLPEAAEVGDHGRLQPGIRRASRDNVGSAHRGRTGNVDAAPRPCYAPGTAADRTGRTSSSDGSALAAVSPGSAAGACSSVERGFRHCLGQGQGADAGGRANRDTGRGDRRGRAGAAPCLGSHRRHRSRADCTRSAQPNPAPESAQTHAEIKIHVGVIQ